MFQRVVHEKKTEGLDTSVVKLKKRAEELGTVYQQDESETSSSDEADDGVDSETPSEDDVREDQFVGRIGFNVDSEDVDGVEEGEEAEALTALGAHAHEEDDIDMGIIGERADEVKVGARYRNFDKKDQGGRRAQQKRDDEEATLDYELEQGARESQRVLSRLVGWDKRTLMGDDDDDDSESDVSSHDDGSDSAEDESEGVQKEKKKTAAAGIVTVAEWRRLRGRQILEAEPELGRLMRDLTQAVNHVDSDLDKQLDIFGAMLRTPRSDRVCSFLEVKKQLLLSYGMCVSYFLLLRANGCDGTGHGVLAYLVKLRRLLAKVKAVEKKLKPDMDCLIAGKDGLEPEEEPRMSVAHARKRAKKGKKGRKQGATSGDMLVQEELGGALSDEYDEAGVTSDMFMWDGNDSYLNAFGNDEEDSDDFLRLATGGVGKNASLVAKMRGLVETGILDDEGSAGRVGVSANGTTTAKSLGQLESNLGVALVAEKARERRAGAGVDVADKVRDSEWRKEARMNEERRRLEREDQKEEAGKAPGATNAVWEMHDRLGAEESDAKKKKEERRKEKKKKKKGRRADSPTEVVPYEGHIPRADQLVDDGARRRVSDRIQRNTGQVRYRKRDERNARLVRRKAYAKKVRRRRGAVEQDREHSSGVYAGERTGISDRVVRGML